MAATIRMTKTIALSMVMVLSSDRMKGYLGPAGAAALAVALAGAAATAVAAGAAGAVVAVADGDVLIAEGAGPAPGLLA